MSLLPAFLDLHGAQAVVIGGGPVALRRARSLLGSGAQVQVIAPQVHPDFQALSVEVTPRHYRRGDLSGARIAVAATDSPDVNGAVVRDALTLGLLVNDASDATRGNLRFAALAEGHGVQVAVNTGRELPTLAQALSERIAELLPSAEQLRDWTGRREHALTLPGDQKQAQLNALRAEIRRAVGVPA
ncbi:bifunctional precorrin-2 dehydrogenase/sirohydrochlorin ferrochelatase [Deinococcus taeanensis]|uniref:precorrin-2 dehydrogenase/sirohydrochlorin ferrochelatase family protein n=1 Tax=Deinococcus taeanensis TaxID=2737050 RepID=UPI001CDCDD29|nr:bifunctional precorrin-2 dehydrogenase/sirohydrochlorin ferrochelatase [Deinococcus taeanensis]UBV43074.1 bifunctional precorrin-2 dehydrogenase/sirohydrochlorin ferrochelatase [Deinococcus taeanensis]